MMFVGLDLGQAHDYTALSVTEKIPGKKARYDVRELQRFPLNLSYPAIVAEVRRRLADPLLARAALVIDATGVGRPVVDLLKPLRPIAVTITGGDKVSRDGNAYRVPKRDLVSTLQVLLQGERLRIAKALPDAQTLMRELLAFKVKIDPVTAHDSYNAWRESDHDDLVLSVALAVWYAERGHCALTPSALTAFARAMFGRTVDLN